MQPCADSGAAEFPANSEKRSEFRAFRPIRVRIVSKNQANSRGFRENSLRAQTGNEFGPAGNKVPCSGESRDNSRADTAGAQLRTLTIEPAPILDDDNDPMTAEASDPTALDPGDEPVSRLAAIVFGRDEAPDEPLIAFVEGAIADGARVAGLVQERADDDLCDRHDVQVRDLLSGETLPIMQDLGPEATGCAVDPAAIAEAARLLARALATNPDLLVVNRFGRLESEGGGSWPRSAAPSPKASQ